MKKKEEEEEDSRMYHIRRGALVQRSVGIASDICMLYVLVNGRIIYSWMAMQYYKREHVTAVTIHNFFIEKLLYGTFRFDKLYANGF